MMQKLKFLSQLELHIYCDGGARGNPGPAAIGFVVKNHRGEIVYQYQQFIGYATNNVAEYRAVIAALEWLIKNKSNYQLPITNYQFFLDSSLVVNQLTGLFKIKTPHLRRLFTTTFKLQQQLNLPLSFTLIPRHQNYQADLLVNQALDRHLSPA